VLARHLRCVNADCDRVNTDGLDLIKLLLNAP
jgi:hypothetical protein